MTDQVITHGEALCRIEEHLGEKVYIGFLVDGACGQAGERVSVLHVIGVLTKPLDGEAAISSPGRAIYQVGGGDWFHLGPMVGSVHLRDSGVDFRPSDAVLVRVAWRGSNEVGDWRLSAESVARFRAVGIERPEHQIESR